MSDSTQNEQQGVAEQPVLAIDPVSSAPGGQQSSTSPGSSAPAVPTSVIHAAASQTARQRKRARNQQAKKRAERIAEADVASATVPLMSSVRGRFHVTSPFSISPNAVDNTPAAAPLTSIPVVEPVVLPTVAQHPQDKSRWQQMRNCCGCFKPEDSA